MEKFYKKKLINISDSLKVKILTYFLLFIILIGVCKTFVYNVSLVPFGIGIVFPLLYLKFNGYILSLIYILSSFLSNMNFDNFLISLNVALILSLAEFLIYKKYLKLHIYQIFIFSLLSMIFYVTKNIINEQNNLALFISIILSELFLYCALCFFRATFGRGMLIKLNLDEKICGAVILIVFMIGMSITKLDIINLGLVFVPIILLISNVIFTPSYTTILSAILGLSFSISNSDWIYISLFVLLSLCLICFKNTYKILSPLSLILGYIIFNLFFNVGVSLGELYSIIIGEIIYLLIPKNLVIKLSNIFQKEPKVMVKDLIYRSKKKIIERVDDLSLVFDEMQNVYKGMVRGNLSDIEAKKLIKEELISNVCKNCPNYNSCFRKYGSFTDNSLDILVDIGYEKGKVLLIDLPSNFAGSCSKINDVIGLLNNMLLSYKDYAMSISNLDVSRVLIADQLSGVSKLLKTLSKEVDININFDTNFQEKIKDELNYLGIICFECVVYEKDSYNKCITLIIKDDTINNIQIEKIISKIVNKKMIINEIYPSDILNASVVSLDCASNYSLAYGESSITKTGVKVSGDNHALLKIDNGRYMVSICDGMGSGNKANMISNLTLSLIENFYKAGFDNDIILNSINKLLSLTEQENYSTLDLCVIDVKKNYYDFIKFGACQSFLIRENKDIEIVESSGLPIGILEDVKPHISTKLINPMDTVIFMSDGIVDSFKNIDLQSFIKNLNIINPQIISDKILEHALELNGGVAIDDMTVICIRVLNNV